MRKMPWAIYLWPGLPQLWRHGSWSALLVAVGAAALLNLMIVASFGWAELIDSGVRNILWGSLGIFWFIAVIISAVQSRRNQSPDALASSEDPFSQVLDLYLKGDYYKVECILHELLGKNVRDLDARLLLATLLRHTRRIDEAQEQLDQLSRFEGAGKWELEIERERELLAEAKKNSKDKPENGMAIATRLNSTEISHAA
jgi:hypothetical protein